MRSAALGTIYTRLASAFIGLCPIVAILGVAAWVYASYWLQLSEATDSYRLQIRKVEWIAENADRLSRELAVADRALDQGVTEASDESDQDLAARLQSDLKTRLDAASLQISSIEATPIRDENGVRFISLKAQASGSYDGIVRFLGSLQGATPPNLIDALDLIPDPTGQGGAGISPDLNCIAQLEVVHLISVGR